MAEVFSTIKRGVEESISVDNVTLEVELCVAEFSFVCIFILWVTCSAFFAGCSPEAVS